MGGSVERVCDAHVLPVTFRLSAPVLTIIMAQECAFGAALKKRDHRAQDSNPANSIKHQIHGVHMGFGECRFKGAIRC